MWLWKKWWAFTLTLALAMMLTSCANKRKSNLTNLSGYAECAGYFQAEIGVYPAGNGKYDVIVNPLAVDQEAPLFKVALAAALSDDSLDIQEFTGTTRVQTNVQYIQENLDIYQFERFTHLVFIPAVTGNLVQDWQDYQDYATVCELPYPQDTSGTNGQFGGFR